MGSIGISEMLVVAAALGVPLLIGVGAALIALATARSAGFTTCGACNQRISRRAPACPMCGAPRLGG